MASIRLGPFLGANKATRPKMLGANAAVESLNHWPDRGDLRPWKALSANLKTVEVGTKTIAMFKRSALTDAVYWLQWTNVVHAINGFTNDTVKRTFYTGDGAPKYTDNTIGLATGAFPTASRALGIPKPADVPIITQTVAGTGDSEERFYAYAYLSKYDELGMPQISAIVTCKPGATLTISSLSGAPSGSYDIDRIRIWRTSAGDAGADFFFLKDITIGVTSTTDAGLGVGSDVMPCKLYAAPPSDLKGLTSLWNGMAAGISGDSVRYCEQFKMHAWPPAYETLCPETPVALAAFQKSLLILTTGRPRMVYGTSPEAMDDAPVEFIAACVSAQSVVSFGHGACWATSDGLAYVGTVGAPRLITDGLMLLDDWKAIVPSTIVASQFNGRYMGFYTTSTGPKGFMIDPLKPENGIYFFSLGYTAAFFDPLEEEMYVMDGLSIKKWNAGTANMTVTHKSKVFRTPKPVNMSVARVIADEFPCTVTLYADGRAGWAKTVSSGDPFWLPDGYYAENFQIEVSTAKDVTGIVIADDIGELA